MIYALIALLTGGVLWAVYKFQALGEFLGAVLECLGEILSNLDFSE